MAGGLPEKQSVTAFTPDPRREFVDFCEAEFARRRNSGEVFDETAYRGAMQLVLDRLGGPAAEDGAR
jgi:hypothetical protein